MKFTKCSHILIFSLFVLTAFGLLIPQTAFCQTEKLGIVQYTPPKGMTKTLKENVVAFSEFNQTTGTYCIITVYGATPGTGNAQSDFTREWKNLVVNTLDKAEANPTVDASTADGWTILAAGSSVESGAGKALAFLTVISGSGKTVSILAVFNDPAYVKQVDTFISGLDLDKPVKRATETAAAVPLALDVDSHIIMPEPKRAFTVADLAGVWEEGGRSSTSYVFQSSGAYAGTDSLAIKIARTIERDGTYTSDFFSIRNGKKERDITTGSITIVGRVLTLRRSNSSTTDKYVIRGWLETPTATILRLAEGPWHNDDVIPRDRFTDFTDFGRFFTKTHWVRKK
jgi:hypothetical protein